MCTFSTLEGRKRHVDELCWAFDASLRMPGALWAYGHAPCYSALIQSLHVNKVTQVLGNTKKTGWSNVITAYFCLNGVVIKAYVEVWVQGRFPCNHRLVATYLKSNSLASFLTAMTVVSRRACTFWPLLFSRQSNFVTHQIVAWDYRLTHCYCSCQLLGSLITAMFLLPSAVIVLVHFFSQETED
jgi:hypothetical protein